MGKRISLTDIELGYLLQLVEDDSKPTAYTSYKCITGPAIETLKAKLSQEGIGKK